MSQSLEVKSDTWACDACTFMNSINDTRCIICNTSQNYLSDIRIKEQKLIEKYIKIYSKEYVGMFYPYPNMKGCNSLEYGVSCVFNNFMYLSGSYIPQNIKWINKNNIKYILNCAYTDVQHNDKSYKNVKLLQLPINDTSKNKSILNKYIDKCMKFINECSQAKCKIVIHCSAGVSRSATVVLVYLMLYKKWNLYDSFVYLRSKRKYIYPNKGFWELLMDIEKTIIKDKKKWFNGKLMELHAECIQETLRNV